MSQDTFCHGFAGLWSKDANTVNPDNADIPDVTGIVDYPAYTGIVGISDIYGIADVVVVPGIVGISGFSQCFSGFPLQIDELDHPWVMASKSGVLASPGRTRPLTGSYESVAEDVAASIRSSGRDDSKPVDEG